MSLVRILQPIKNKIFLMIARGIVSAVDNSGKTQKISLAILQNESMTKIEKLEPYGFSYFPRKGTEAVILFPNGERRKGFITLIHDRESRPTDGLEGEVIIYTHEDKTLLDNRIHLKTGKIHEHKCVTQNVIATTSAIITTPLFKVISASIKLGIIANVKKLINEEFKNLYNTHTHKNVQPGIGNSGVPNQLITSTHQTTNLEAS